MKKFAIYLIKLILVVIPSLIPVLVIYNSNLKKTEKYQTRNNFICKPIILTGSSHGRDAFRSSTITSSYNLSVKGFTIEQTYDDLKLSLESCNEKIETVIISFSIFTLRKVNFPYESTGVLSAHNEFSNYSFFNDNSRKDIFLGSNANLNTGEVNSSAFNHKAKKQFLTHTTPLEPTKKQIAHDYFNKIIDLKNKYEFRLIFVTTPFSNPYNEIISNHEFWKEDLKFITSNTTILGYEYYNFQEYFSTDSIFFKDPSHLSQEGSIKFSKHLETFLESKK